LATLPSDAHPEIVFTAGIEDAEWVSPQRYELGSEIDFSTDGNSTDFAPSGWSDPEPWGRFTVGPLAELSLPLDRPLGPGAMFKAIVRPHLNRHHRPLKVEIYFGKHVVKKLSLYIPGRRTIRIAIPAALCANETQAKIGIRILNPKSPLSLGESQDARQLGLGFIRAWLK
jgi:hypothetical protein